MTDSDELRLRLKLSARLARESLAAADAQLAALKEKHKKDQQLRSLKRQLAHRSEYRKRTPDTINTQRKRKYSRVPPHIDASSLRPNLPATLTTPSFDIKQLESTLRPSLVDSAPRDRENDASNAVSDTVPLEYDIKRTHALPLRPNIPTTPTTPTTPSSTPSTPSFDIEQLELALPSPISDSDPFWDLDSTTGTTGTDTDEDQSTAASHTAPLKYDTPPTPPQLKLALPSSIPCSDPCWDMDEDESTAASDTAPLEYHKAGIIADAPLPRFVANSDLGLTTSTKAALSTTPFLEQNEGHFNSTSCKLSSVDDLSSNRFVPNASQPACKCGIHLSQLILSRCTYLLCVPFVVLLLYITAAFTFSDVLSSEELRLDILDVIRAQKFNY
ncbi:hypothetical protein AB1N83_008544 [Pleurotus pulmonarius]